MIEDDSQTGKKSFLFYYDYRQHLSLFTYEQIGRLTMALLSYAENGEIPKLSEPLEIAFSFMRTQIDRDNEKYVSRCKKNRENGLKGGRPKNKHG